MHSKLHREMHAAIQTNSPEAREQLDHNVEESKEDCGGGYGAPFVHPTPGNISLHLPGSPRNNMHTQAREVAVAMGSSAAGPVSHELRAPFGGTTAHASNATQVALTPHSNP